MELFSFFAFSTINFKYPCSITLFMAFSKSFAKRSDKSVYPRWDDVYLSEGEEREAESLARKENLRLLKECIADARKILKDENMKGFETSIVSLAVALFDKRASHHVYWKENKALEKFIEKEK